MARFGGYLGTHTGTLKIYVGPWSVGTGQFGTFGDFEVKFDGSYDFAGQSGNLAIAIKQTNQNPQESAGPCTVTLNGTNDATATYKVHGDKLTIITALNGTPIDLYVKQGGTQVDNISGHNLWIGQWG